MGSMKFHQMIKLSALNLTPNYANIITDIILGGSLLILAVFPVDWKSSVMNTANATACKMST